MRIYSARIPLLGRMQLLWGLALLISGGQLGSALADNHSIYGLQFSPDGRYLAAISNNNDPAGPLVLWDVVDWTWIAIHTPSKGGLDLDFSPTGDQLAYCTRNGKVAVLEVPSLAVLQEFDLQKKYAIMSVTFAPDEESVYFPDANNNIGRWKIATGELISTFKGHSDRVNDIAVSPDGLTLLSGGNDRQARVWDVASQQVKQTLPQRGSIVRRVAFSNDGNYFLVSAWDGKVRIRKASTGDLCAQLDSAGNCADITRDNRLIAVAAHSSTAYVYSVGLRSPTLDEQSEIEGLIGRFELDSYDERERAAEDIKALGLIAEPQLHKAMTSKDAEVRVRARILRKAVMSPEPVAKLTGHTGDIEVMSFSPDGKYLATSCQRGEVKVWDTTSFAEVVTLHIVE